MSKLSEEQELELNDAVSKLRAALRMIEALFDDEDITQEDVDSDTSEAIDKCNSAIEDLYEAKKVNQ